MITIVDYGMGNLASIQNMLKRIGHDSRISSNPREVLQADKLILPGVGAFDAGMQNLRNAGMADALDERVLGARVPVLGICLGMQLMTRGSEEGSASGLGWIDAETLHFRRIATPSMKIPHMGWNTVEPLKPSALLEEARWPARFYFVHSYFVKCRDPQDALLHASYGGTFDAAFERGNLSGVQFHPEKSHTFGMRLLRNFAGRYKPC